MEVKVFGSSLLIYYLLLFHDYLSGFRKGYSCQDVLIRMTEDWREAIDSGHCVGVVAIDLSKAFDLCPMDSYLQNCQHMDLTAVH